MSLELKKVYPIPSCAFYVGVSLLLIFLIVFLSHHNNNVVANSIFDDYNETQAPGFGECRVSRSSDS